MGKHILQLNFPDCPNQGVFLIDDISIYDGVSPTGIGSTTGLPIACGNLQITPPGYTVPSQLTVNPQFRLVLNACTLGMMPPQSCSGCCPDLPDGLWNIRYSVAPNDKVYVEYKILRIVEAWKRYMELLCRVGLTPCLPDNEVQQELMSLDIIRNYLLSAKGTVENKHQFADGMNQYNFAVELMDKMSYNRPC